MEKQQSQQERENPSALPPPSPKSNTNPCPTTFVQADTSSFKQVVQMLTGTAETAAAAANPPPPNNKSTKAATGPKKPAFKLYERRNSLKNLDTISPLLFQHNNNCTAFSPRKQQTEVLSPSLLDFPSLVLSPVTPLIADPFNGAKSAEEKAIAEKGFYLHPSPRSAEPPRLLPLFPVTSPRAPSCSSSECGISGQ